MKSPASIAGCRHEGEQVRGRLAQSRALIRAEEEQRGRSSTGPPNVPPYWLRLRPSPCRLPGTGIDCV